MACCHRTDCASLKPTGTPGVVNACTKKVREVAAKVRHRDADLLRSLAR